MKLEHAQRIVRAANDIGLDVTLREDYSGRGMYGKTTTGVVGSQSDIIASIATAAYWLGQDSVQKEDIRDIEDVEGDEAFLEAMGQLVFDNMGRDNLIVY